MGLKVIKKVNRKYPKISWFGNFQPSEDYKYKNFLNN